MRQLSIQNIDQEGNRIQDPIRFTGSLAGRFYMDKWHWTDDRARYMPQCTVTLVTPERMVLTCTSRVEAGENAFVYIEEIGLIRGTISRVIGARVHLDIAADENARKRIEASILWLERKNVTSISDKRVFPRYRPKEDASSIVVAGGSPIPCRILNVSPMGAAVVSELRPEIRARIELGAVPGEVVRHTDIGFGLAFLKVQDPRVLESLLLPIPGTDSAFMLGQNHIVV